MGEECDLLCLYAGVFSITPSRLSDARVDDGSDKIIGR